MNIPCEVIDGLIPSEKIARITTAEGKVEEVAVDNQQIRGNTLVVAEVGRDENRVLVELPRESTSGRWRMWVNAPPAR